MYIKNNNAFITVSPTLEELKALSSAQRVKENEFGITISNLFALVKRADVNPVLRVTTNAGNTVEYVFTNMTKGTFQGVVYYTLKFVSGDDILSLTAYPSTSNFGVSFKGYGSTIAVTPVVTDGTIIARISVDGTSYNIKAPANSTGNKVNVVLLLDELIAAAADTVQLSIEDDLDEDQLAIVTALEEYISHYVENEGTIDAIYSLTQFYTDDSEHGNDLFNEILYPTSVWSEDAADGKKAIIFTSEVNRKGTESHGNKTMETSFYFYPDEVTEKPMLEISRKFIDLNDYEYETSISSSTGLETALLAALNNVSLDQITTDTKLVIKAVDATDGSQITEFVFPLAGKALAVANDETHVMFSLSFCGAEPGENDSVVYHNVTRTIEIIDTDGTWTYGGFTEFVTSWDGTDTTTVAQDITSVSGLGARSTITFTNLKDIGGTFN